MLVLGARHGQVAQAKSARLGHALGGVEILVAEGEALGVEAAHPRQQAALDRGVGGVVEQQEHGVAARAAPEDPRPPELPPEIVDQALAQECARRAAAAAVPESVRERLPDELIDELLAGRSGEAEVLGRDGLLGELTKRLLERAMAGETAHLGYEPHHEPPGGTGNARNGMSSKTVQTQQGPVQIDRPRDPSRSPTPRLGSVQVAQQGDGAPSRL